MKLIAILVVALVAWVGLRGSLGPSAVIVLGTIAVALLARHGRSMLGPRLDARFLTRVAAVAELTVRFGWELLASNVQQLRVVFGPSHLIAPHWLAFRTELQSPALRATLGALVCLTPGTLTADVEEDGTVWLHVLVAEDDTSVVARLRERLEAPLRRLES